MAPTSRSRSRVRALKAFVWVAGLSPLIFLAGKVATGALSANPSEEIIHLMGRWALVFLLASLAVTPIRRLTGWNPVIQSRRLLGLFAYFYLALHFLAYAGLDQLFGLPFIIEDVLERPYIAVGFIALVLLTPLAITSTRGWIRRLGRGWRRLHRLVYVASALGVLHYYWQVKADTRWAIVAALVLGGLFAIRVGLPVRRARTSSAEAVSTGGALT
jgi:sulfoxide reductase heme-binding subunit YedZ